VENLLDGWDYNPDAIESKRFWIGVFSASQKMDWVKASYLQLFSGAGCASLSCYVRSVAQSGRRLLSSKGYIACRAGGDAMGNETNEKQEQIERPAERQPEYVKRAQGEVNANVSDYTEKVIATRLEKKLSGNSGVTGKYPDENGKGLASAKDLLGDNAHGFSKKEKQAALLAQIEKDGYIVGKSQDKPILVAEKLEEQKKTAEKNNEKLMPEDGKTYSLKQLLNDYNTPFMDAYERSKGLKDGEPGKSKTLETIVARLKECPWSDQMHFKFDSKAKNSEYDELTSTVTINLKHSTQKQIEEFAHESYHATHQFLNKLYAGDKLDQKTYTDTFMWGEVGSMLAEAAVHSELGHAGHTDFNYLKPDGKPDALHIDEFMKTHTKKDLFDFLYTHPPAGKGEKLYPEHYAANYKNYEAAYQKSRPAAVQYVKRWVQSGHKAEDI